MKKNVLEWLEETKENLPKKVAFFTEEDRITFEEVEQKAKQIGSCLVNKIEIGEPVAVFAKKSVITPAMFLGVVYAGGCYAPVDAALPLVRIQSMLEVLSPRIILADESSKGVLEKLSFTGQVIYLEEIQKKKEVTQEDLEMLWKVRRKSVEDQPLYVIFTSGSSGRPKAVMTSHHALMNYIEAYAEVMGIESDDVLGNQSPLDYIAAIRDIYLPLRYGCSTLLIPKTLFMQPDRLFAYMNENKVTSIGWSVSALSVPVSLGAFEDVELFTLKKICFSGSVMPCAVLKKWQEHIKDALFVNQYGPTEATASSTYYIVDHLVDENEILPIGVPYTNYRIYIVKEDNTLARQGEMGEICIAGPGLALGYYNDPKRTADSFTVLPGFTGYPLPIYRTGDIGRQDEQGLLWFLGRKDRQVKHLGHRIELDEVEYAASKWEGIGECSVLYHKEKEWLFLFYTGVDRQKELATWLRKSLPGFMVPRKMIFLEKMPHLPNGKIDLQSLRQMMEELAK